MENFQFSKTETGIHIEGFPDAIKVIPIDGAKAQKLADYALHKADLEFAADCLIAINEIPQSHIREALWRSAVVHFMKCFGQNKGRPSSLSKDIYKKNQLALDAFDLIDTLRDKHFIHDENSYAQCISCAAINDGKKEFKIEKIFCFPIIAITLNQENYNNLSLLIEDALKLVISKFDELCELLTKALETETHENLFNREAITLNMPKFEEIRKTRLTLSKTTKK